MKYDLKNLRQAIDERIPEIQPDEGILHQAMKPQSRPYERFLTGALTAAAACMLLFAVLGALLADGVQLKPDDVGNRPGQLLSPGGTAPEQVGTPLTQPTQAPFQAALEEDLSPYQVYSPDYAFSALPDEMTFGNVVIKRLHDYDGLYVFEDETSGELVIEGRFWQAFAYFPATQTGLVKLGPNEGLQLVNRDREVMEGSYSHFQYVGNGVAIVADRDAYETEPDPMYLISTLDGRALSAEYAIIGKTYTSNVCLLLGHDNQELYGEFDILDMQGRVIVRAQEFGGMWFDKWISVQLPGEEDYVLMDLEGNIQMDGQRLRRVSFEKNGYMIIATESGSGVIDSNGDWVFEPGRYLNIEIREDGLFVVRDKMNAEKMQINAQGEQVDTLKFRWELTMDALGEAYADWRESVGELGYIVICLLCGWLLLRIGIARRNGEALHMIVTELGFAAYIAALLLIGHRNSYDYVTLWPTDTATKGANVLGGWWNLASVGLLASLIAAYPKLRNPKKAFSAGYAFMILPWVWKAACRDMRVFDWEVMSIGVFAGGATLAVLLHWVRPVKRFMEWCGRFDALNEYSRWIRIVWWALVMLALVNFGAGCFMSGQELEEKRTQAEVQRGVLGRFGEVWVEEVNQLLADYPEDDYDSALSNARDMSEREYMAIQAARWLKENGVAQMTKDMILRVRVTGSVQLAREATAQIVLEAVDGNGFQLSAEFIPSLPDGTIESEAVFILLPGEPAPDIEVWLSIRQPISSQCGIAAQHYYRADLPTVTVPDLAPEQPAY